MLSFLTKEITRKEKRSLKKQITFRNDHFIKFSLHVVIIALTLPPTNSSAMTSAKVERALKLYSTTQVPIYSFLPCFEIFINVDYKHLKVKRLQGCLGELIALKLIECESFMINGYKKFKF